VVSSIFLRRGDTKKMNSFAKEEESAAVNQNQERRGKTYVWRIVCSFLAAFALFFAACEDPNIPDPDTDTDSELPADVSELSGTAVTGGTVTLSWKDPAGVDINHIEITWISGSGTSGGGTSGGGTIAEKSKDEDRSNSITISSLSDETVYTFTVKVVNTAGIKSTGKIWQNTLTADPSDPDKDPPGNVEELRTIPGNGAVTLSWIDPADDDLKLINIEWSGGGSSGSTTQEKSEGGDNSKTVTGLTNGTSYTFTVSTQDTAGNKSATKRVSGTPDASKSNVAFDFSGMPADEAVDLLDPISPLSWSANTQLIVSVPSGFVTYRWYLDGSPRSSDPEKANQLTLNAGALAVKQHTLTVFVTKSSGEYSKRLNFSVVQ
jgi:hypothetical protein